MKKYLLFSILVYTLTSCGSKKIAYFQDIEESVQGKLNETELINTLKIKQDDELSIIVSAEDPLIATPFNLPLISSGGTNYSTEQRIGPNIQHNQTMQAYLVDSNGDITMPILGKIRAKGLTTEELNTYLVNRLKEYIKDPIVNIRIINFRISVLGEVLMPGTYSFNNRDVTVLDAIASAKDLTIHGNRNIVVIRRNGGLNEYHHLDLTSSEIFSSPYFFLQQNDIVYALPNKEKQRDSASGQQKQFNLQVITSTIGYIISIIAILIR